MGRHAAVEAAAPHGDSLIRTRRFQLAAAAVALGAVATLTHSFQGDSAPHPGDKVAAAAVDSAPAPEVMSEDAVIELDAHGPYIGIDVAKRQQNFNDPNLSPEENMEAGMLDVEQLQRDGFDFMFAKASEGTSFVDDYFAENRRRAQDAKMLFGAYHYLSDGDGIAQADHFYKRLADTGGAEGAMLMLDVEHAGSYEDVTDFTTRMHELVPDRDIIIYTLSKDWGSETREGRLGNPPAPEGTVLNIANYVDNNRTDSLLELVEEVAAPDTPGDPYPENEVGTWDEFAFRQFTSEGTYAQYQAQELPDKDYGQSTLDGDISFLPREELLELAGLSPEDTPQAPATTELSDADQMWEEWQAKDPAQTIMEARPECVTPEVADMSSQERYAKAFEQLHAFEPSKEKYEDAIASIIDIRNDAKETYPRNFAYDANDSAFDEVTDIKSQVNHFVLHFTAEDQPERDGMEMAAFMDELDRGTGYNYYINRTPEKAETYYTSDQFAYQVKDKSSDIFGVEVAACTQADITPEQYEQTLYLTAHFMESNGFINKDQPVAAFVENFVQGHREMVGANGHSDWPEAVTAPFKQRLINFLVDELGYKR